MRKNISIIDLDCCGCLNCEKVCAKHAIKITASEEGFLYPELNNNCTECGACLKVCPQTKDFTGSLIQVAYAAISKDEQVMSKASSGGVFGTIAKHILQKKNSYVCTASFVDGEVKHIITNKLDDIKRCQGSKYVQSNIGDCIPQIKMLLKSGSLVLFCGTPCQVAALYSYLGSRHENLYTLDLICHGVPSPLFFKKNMKHYCKSFEKINDIRFRWKNPFTPNRKSSFILNIEKENGYELYSSSYDPYFASFMRGESFRQSCYQCKYSNLNRMGDITIGDFDSHNLYPEFCPEFGKSTVIINTNQGYELWKETCGLFHTLNIDLDKEAAVNHQLDHPFKKSVIRDFIYQDVKRLSFKELQKKYARPNTKQQKILFAIQTYIPELYKLVLLKNKL